MEVAAMLMRKSPCGFRKCGVRDLARGILVGEVECFYCMATKLNSALAALSTNNCALEGRLLRPRLSLQFSDIVLGLCCRGAPWLYGGVPRTLLTAL